MPCIVVSVDSALLLEAQLIIKLDILPLTKQSNHLTTLIPPQPLQQLYHTPPQPLPPNRFTRHNVLNLTNCTVDPLTDQNCTKCYNPVLLFV